MNVLCHLALARPTPEDRLGQFLGDFAHGPLEQLPYPPAVVDGIRAHRRIDACSDVHPFTRQAKRFLPAPSRRFGGLVLDLLGDFLLHRHWDTLLPTPKPLLIAEFNDLLARPPVPLPERARRFADVLLEYDLLAAYADLEEIGDSLQRLGKRLRRPVDLSLLLPPLLAQNAFLDAGFPPFFRSLGSQASV